MAVELILGDIVILQQLADKTVQKSHIGVNMKIRESGENYLETILQILHKKGSVRSIDIANRLNYSKSSVSRAVNILKKEGYITISKDGDIKFTEKGNEKANSTYNRHCLLTEFLIDLGVDNITAENDACRIEHVISDKTFEAIKNKFKLRN